VDQPEEVVVIKRSKPVYLADTLVDVEVVNLVQRDGGRKRRVTHMLTVGGERRSTGRVVLFPRPTVQLDQQSEPVSVTLHVRSWLINDGVIGTLPVVADRQHAARILADAFLTAVQHGVVDNVGDQVHDWCASYVREHDDVELIVGWSGLVRHVEATTPTHVAGVLGLVAVDQVPDEVVGQRGPFIPAVDPDSIDRVADGLPEPAFAHTTEVAQ
jgi:hypothetical protein